MRSLTLDVGRTRRALRLHVEHVGDGRHRVTGGTAEHVVDTSEIPWTCDCMDAAFRPDARCKHMLATYFVRQLAPAVRVALRSAVTVAP